ncbi:DUF3473 domain-containing protein [Vibrio sp. Of7-15]|uniref:XrtA system polysaccharide deacetylase n=1 Tax=Vibrio sp. Of7-15 TaxID=2724879 RepID=UPI001EF1CF7E|nr:DUF3473 domain-containing protein [Vibrio sp. Of7-15]
MNALTMDVEDYFQVAAFSSKIDFDDWGKTYPVRVEESTTRALEIFSEHNAKATFFILGWVAEAYPSLVQRIANEGHEIASHGYAHQKANTQSRQEFKNDVYRSKAFIEDLTGQEIKGYRAPSFSIDTSNEWAFDVLYELGFRYSSSTYPVKHDHYGAPTWPRFKHTRPEGIIELPIPTSQFGGKSIPIGGGGFFRLYPYWLSRLLIRQFMTETGQPYSFYFHPWEIDHLQPKVSGVPLKSQLRHYLNLKLMEGRLKKLLTDFQWGTMRQVYKLD